MRSFVLATVAMLFAVSQAKAALNTFYRGRERMGDTKAPATAQYSIEKKRVALVVRPGKEAAASRVP